MVDNSERYKTAVDDAVTAGKERRRGADGDFDGDFDGLLAEFQVGDEVTTVHEGTNLRAGYVGKIIHKEISGGQVAYQLENDLYYWESQLRLTEFGDKITDVDMVNHPPHYMGHPSGVECIEITRHYNFALGSAIKYIWRAGLKGDTNQHVEDLRKAIFYIEDEIRRIS